MQGSKSGPTPQEPQAAAERSGDPSHSNETLASKEDEAEITNVKCKAWRGLEGHVSLIPRDLIRLRAWCDRIQGGIAIKEHVLMDRSNDQRCVSCSRDHDIHAYTTVGREHFFTMA